MTIGQLIEFGNQALIQQYHKKQKIAELFLSELLARPYGYLLAHQEDPVDPSLVQCFKKYVQEALHYKPIAYILGKQEFYGLNFEVNEHTLIPRSETEIIVEWVLKNFDTSQTISLLAKKISLLDLGTGTGAIACAIAHHCPHWDIKGVDIDAQALKIAQKNKETLKTDNVQFFKSNWFSKIPKEQRFNIIVANPPYIDEKDTAIEFSVRHFEPSLALFTKENGLKCIKDIVSEAKNYLAPQGWLIIEHGYQQHEEVKALFNEYGYRSVLGLPDLQNHWRVCYGHCPSDLSHHLS